MPPVTWARVHTASPDTSLAELVGNMNKQNVGKIVITNGNKSVEIVPNRVLVVRMLGAGVEPSGLTSVKVLSKNLFSVNESASFYTVAELMNENVVRRLPSYNDDNELTGIITADDFSEFLEDEKQQR